MPDKSHYIGGGLTESNLNPVVLVAMLIAIVLMLTIRRKHVIVPVLIMMFLVPLGQTVYAMGTHWQVCRFITLAGLLRMMMLKGTSKGSVLAGGFNSVDKAFLGCVVCQAIGFSLQYMETQAVINQLGILIDFLGGYFVLRAMIHDEADIYLTLKWIAFITLLLAIGMVWEQLTLKNVFGLLGGTRAVPEIREGKIRSQGVFQHSLTAGVFAATLLPLFLLLWKNGKAVLVGGIGICSCTVMTICSNSSTPLLAYAASVAGMCLWPIRKKMRTVRRGLVVILVALHLIMSAPVWFLIARIDLTGGSSGYHRAELIDQCISHFSEWWLIGTKDAGSWADDLWDQQNQYVSVGQTGGLAALVLFIAMISRLCARIGTARKLAGSRKEQWFFWYLGAALFANMVGFFGVNYFDQSKMGWFMLLAMIIAATTPMLQMQGLKETEVEATPETEPSDSWRVAIPAVGHEARWANEF